MLLTTQGWALVRIIPAVISSITKITHGDTQMITALVHALRTVAAVGEARWTVHLVTQVTAITITITAEVRGDTVTTGALECTVLKYIKNI